MTDQLTYWDGGTATGVFLQWKGTDACMDVHCECGWGGHVDGFFAYAWRCANCNAVYQMTSHPTCVRNDNYVGSVLDPDGGEMELDVGPLEDEMAHQPDDER